MEKPKTRKRMQYLVAACVSLSTMAGGAMSSWPAPVLPKFYDNQTDIVISPDEMAWMVSMSSPGFMTGSLVTRFTADRLGRRNTLLASVIPVLAGTIIVAFTAKARWLFLMRYLWGCGCGMILTVTIIYVAEISQKEIRGTLGMIARFMFNFGNLLIMTIGPFVSYTTLNYMLFALPISYFITCCWIPESPYQSLKEGKLDVARKTLFMLRRYKDKKVLEEDLEDMRLQVATEMRRSTSFVEFITGKQYRKAIIIAVGLKFTQMLGGQLVIQQYIGIIMKESQSNIALSTVLVIFGAVRFFVGVLSSIVVDKIGRRPLLIYSYAGTGLSLAFVGLYFFFLEVIHLDHTSLKPYGFVTFTGLVLSIIISTLGYNSAIQVVFGEIFPMNIKAVATSSISVFGGSLGFLVYISYQSVKDWWGLTGVFSIFAVSSFIASMFCYFVVPETKGKSLKEIQQILQGDLYDEDKEVQERLNPA